MPATQNYRLTDWREPPFLTGTHELELRPHEVLLASKQKCVEFILLQGLQEIAAYEGYPEKQQEFAEDIAEEIFDPTKCALQSLSEYVTAQDEATKDPKTVMDERLRVAKAKRNLERKINPNGPQKSIIISLEEHRPASKIRESVVELPKVKAFG